MGIIGWIFIFLGAAIVAAWFMTRRKTDPNAPATTRMIMYGEPGYGHSYSDTPEGRAAAERARLARSTKAKPDQAPATRDANRRRKREEVSEVDDTAVVMALAGHNNHANEDPGFSEIHPIHPGGGSFGAGGADGNWSAPTPAPTPAPVHHAAPDPTPQSGGWSSDPSPSSSDTGGYSGGGDSGGGGGDGGGGGGGGGD